MVDRQFSQKNGIAIIQSPTLTPPLEPKWVSPEIEPPTEKKKFKFDDHMSNTERLVLCLSEFGGTAILVLLGCMGCARGMVDSDISGEQISLSFGLAVMIGVQIFGHISGAHINPAVTTAAATLGHLPLIQVPIFFTGQLLGSMAGFGLLKVGLVEFILTFILIWACCAVWDSRNKSSKDSVALRLGFTVTGLALAGGPYSGAHMNPARSFGPAVINGDWDFHLVYWLGPLGGGFVAALVYRIIFSRDPSSNETIFEVQTSASKT